MSKIRIVLEAAKSVHPMAVHAYPSEKGKFTVHATGSKVQHVKKGDTVSSSDLDDLSGAGHKVKEVKKPMSEGTSGSGGHRTKDGTYVPFKSFEKAGQEIRAKRANAGRALADADKKTRANAKEEVEQVAEIKKPVGYIEKAGASYGAVTMAKGETDPGTSSHEHLSRVQKNRREGIKRAMTKEEVEQVDEKLTPEAKSAVRTALGPKTPGNQMRKSSQAARTLISVLKSNKKNVAEADDAGSVKQKAIQKYVDQGYSYNDAVKKAEIYVKKKKLM